MIKRNTTRQFSNKAPGSTLGPSRTLQLMTRTGTYRAITIHQRTTFEMLIVEPGEKNAREILFDSAISAELMRNRMRQDGVKFKSGERHVGI